ncbi:hypothetical protein FOBRF1_002002 [Fusarium oxysporum]
MSLSTSTLWVELAISPTGFTQHPRPGLFAFERICELLHSVVNITRHYASQFKETRRHQYDHSRDYPGNLKQITIYSDTGKASLALLVALMTGRCQKGRKMVDSQDVSPVRGLSKNA